jgi:hypothetical protein
MTGNIVFVSVNAALLVSAIAGQLIYLRNRRRKARSEGEGRKANEGPSGPRSAQEA